MQIKNSTCDLKRKRQYVTIQSTPVVDEGKGNVTKGKATSSVYRLLPFDQKRVTWEWCERARAEKGLGHAEQMPKSEKANTEGICVDEAERERAERKKS